MANRRYTSRMNYRQKQYLLKYMEQNLGFAHNKLEGADASYRKQQKWKELCNSLNELSANETPLSVAGWQKRWSNWKGKVKQILNNQQKTAVGSTFDPANNVLDEDSERVFRILNMISVNGDEELQEYGCSKTEPLSTHSEIAFSPASSIVSVITSMDNIQSPSISPQLPLISSVETLCEPQVPKANSFEKQLQLEEKKLQLKEKELQLKEIELAQNKEFLDLGKKFFYVYENSMKNN